MKSKSSQKAIWMALAAIPTLANAETSVVAEETAQAAVLPEVSVSVSKEAEEKFRAESTSVATKTETALRDIPQSVSIVTEELIKSQRAFNLREALKNVSGLSIAAGEGGRTGDSITLRGYSANSDMYLDGVKDNGQYNRDTFFIERAEVLKGSSSVMFGRGSTGGVINQTSKQADGKTRLEANVSGGTDDFKRVTVDAGTALNDVVSLRLNALWQDADSFRDENFVEREGIAPSVRFTFTDDTRLTLNYLHQREDGVFDYGLPMVNGRPAKVSIDTFYGFTDDRLQRYETDVASAIFEHEFSDVFSVKNTLRYGDYERNYRTHLFAAANGSTGDGEVRLSQALRRNTQENLFNQTDFVLKTPLFGFDNTLVFGTEFGTEEYDFKSKNSTGNRNVSINDPILASTWGTGRANDFSGMLATDRLTKTYTRAGYAMNQLELNKQWKVLAGVRYDVFEAEQTNRLTDERFTSKDHVWSPRTGLVWQPTEVQSYYVSYGSSFNPSAETFSLDESTAELDPEKNRNIEVGAKWDVFDGRMTLTSAIYRLEKFNARTDDPSDPDITIMGGKQRTDGFELGLAGEIASGWNLSAAYAYMDGEIVKSSTFATGTVSGESKSLEGMTSTNTPRHSGTVWTTYRFLGDWEAGGGVFFSDARYVDSVNEVKLPGYARLDGVIAYHQPKYDVQLNVYNLLDKRYYESAQSRSALPGVPLSGMLTLTLRY